MKKLFVSLLIFLAAAAPIFAATTQLTWYGHAAFKITTPAGKVILVDPWISNPLNKNAKEDLAKMEKVDLILVTHGHFDHVGDAVEIGKRTHAKLVTTFDLGNGIVRMLGYPKDQAGLETQGNFGGELSLLDGEVQVAFIPAVHSSSVTKGDESDPQPGGNPGGFLISVRGGPTIYHTGDTDLFSDMALISRYRKVTVMLACIGDHFTMGPARAAEAVRLVGPAMVVPMHFGTFPALTGTPDAFRTQLENSHVKVTVKTMTVGETIPLPNAQ
ncbi:MAG: metal-dependent hydrolase [Chthoniobacterales bacterium]